LEFFSKNFFNFKNDEAAFKTHDQMLIID
jgi:hypothetical protein